MARAALVRILFLAVLLAPVVRVTCDVSCIHPPDPASPPCHETSQERAPETCSHDHGQIAARVAIPHILFQTAIVPVAAIMPAPAEAIPINVIGEAAPLASRRSPQAILRV